MSAHTPGPWFVANPECSDLNIYARGQNISGVVCRVNTGWPHDAQKAEQAANAQLITAAPDMLLALRRAVLALAFAAESSEAMRDDYKVVSDAIAKATGGQP